LAFAVLARLVVLLLVAAVTFFLADVGVDVFLVVDPRVGVLRVLDCDAATFFLVVVEVLLVVVDSEDSASIFSADGVLFLRMARGEVLPAC